MRSARILVVDDEPHIRRTIQLALEAAQYTVVTAGDGEEGEARVREGPRPDLVIVDERLPGIDGLETIRRIRKLDPEVPLLLATAYGATDLIASALREGASGYLGKPFTPGELRDVVERVLAAHVDEVRPEETPDER
jgi:two-component system response regulator (stage 0 sporulation protein F)